MGVFITRGVDADGLDLTKKWEFNATASVVTKSQAVR